MKHLAAHAPLAMLLCTVAGFLLPNVAETLLPLLPAILFFLMLFTLLGIEPRPLLRALASAAAWRFALWHGGILCALYSGGFALLGIRGDLLLAIAGVTATAPLFASGAMVRTVGHDALPAMAQTIAATLLMPWLLLAVFYASGSGASLNLHAYTQKLFLYIAAPIVLAALLRRYLPPATLARLYPRIAQYNILLVLTFPFALSGAFRRLYDAQGLIHALELLAIALTIAVGGFFLTWLGYRRFGANVAVPAAITAGGRNVLLTLSIAGGYLGDQFLALAGAMQLPMFALPFLARLLFAPPPRRD